MGTSGGLPGKAMRFLSTPGGKRVGRRVLGGAAAVADRVTGRRYQGRIESVRRTAQQGLDRL